MNKRLCTCVAFVLAVPSLACAQLDRRQAPDHARTGVASAAGRDRAEGLIKLDVLVTDAAGKPVSGLDRADFSLLENGREQRVLSFEEFDARGAGFEPPVKIILLIDTLELPENLVRAERLAVETYLRQAGGRLEHPVSVFLLAETGLWTVTRPSVDGSTLAREIEHNDFMPVRRNVSWQWSAAAPGPQDHPADSALKALGQIATDERRMPGRKLLIWVGPGSGIGSGAYEEIGGAAGSKTPFYAACWFSTLLREARMPIYSVSVEKTDPRSHLYLAYLNGLDSPKKASFMNLYTKVLAVQSGGRVGLRL